MEKLDSKSVYIAFMKFITEDSWEDNLAVLVETFNENYIYPNIKEREEALPSIEFIKKDVSALGSSSYTYGAYDILKNSVEINVPVLDMSDMTKRIVYAMQLIDTLSHEHRHFFQRQHEMKYIKADELAKLKRREEFYMSVARKSKKEYKMDVEGEKQFIISQIAQRLSETFLQREYDDKEVSDLIKILSKTMSKYNLSDEERKKLISDIGYALYFKDKFEVDAREYGLVVCKEFIDDVKGYDPEVGKVLDELHQTVFMTLVEQIRSKNENLYSGFVKDIENFKEQGLYDAAILFEKFIETERYFLSVDGVRYDPKRYEREYQMFSDGIEALLKNSNQQQIVAYYHTLTKMGLEHAGHIVGKHVNSRGQEYFNLLSNDDDITIESFYDLKFLSDKQRIELFEKYLKEDKIEFAEQILYSYYGLGDESLKSLLSKGEYSFEELEKKHGVFAHLLHIDEYYYKHSLTRLISEKIDAIELKSKENNLLYDDLHDMLRLMESILEICQINCITEDEVPSDELENKIFQMYKRLDRIGFEEVKKKLSREPYPDEYRFRHSADRWRYLLTGEDAIERYRHIYGEFECKKRIIEKEENKSEDDKKINFR